MKRKRQKYAKALEGGQFPWAICCVAGRNGKKVNSRGDFRGASPAGITRREVKF